MAKMRVAAPFLAAQTDRQKLSLLVISEGAPEFYGTKQRGGPKPFILF